MPEIRRIRAEERESALTTIVQAFRADPQVRWYFPDDGHYEDGARQFFGVLLDTRVEGGEVWVAGDCDAVAMWNPPGGNLIGPEAAEARYARALAALPAPSGDRVAEVDRVVDRMLPQTPHWYLGVLACRPGRQGQGLGSAVVAPVLELADRAGLPVALETSTQANVAYYTRRGFAVTGQAVVGEATVWVMRREPAGPRTSTVR